MDFIDTVVGDPQARNVDFLTIHPRTKYTPSRDAINVEALRILTDKYGDVLPILVSGDVFTLNTLPFSSPLHTTASSSSALPISNGHIPEVPDEPEDEDAELNGRPPDSQPGTSLPARPSLPKLAGLMSARAILANPALYAGAERCTWEAVERFMNRVARAPLSVKLVLHHLSDMTSPGMGPDKRALLSRRERSEMMNCATMVDLIDFLDSKAVDAAGRRGLRREPMPG